MTERLCPPPSNANDPGFLTALRTSALRELVERHLASDATVLDLRPDYVRWKDQDGSLVGYHVVVQNGDEVTSTYVVARSAPPLRLADEASRLLHRATEDHAGLRAFAFVPHAQLLLLGFPIDRQMHDLRRLVRASKVRSLVEAVAPSLVPPGHRFSKSRSSWQLVAYKPERRAVLRWQIGLVAEKGDPLPQPTLWIRCHAEAQAHRTTTATAAAARGGVRCPRTLGIAHDRLMFESHVEGRPWTPFHRLDSRDVERAARAVATLHGAPPPVGLPAHHTTAELDLVLAAAEDLGRLDPRLGTIARSLAERLVRTVPPARETVFAHGDLHSGQVLLDDGEAGLVDFDRACTSSPARDLGALIAQSVERDPHRGAATGREFVAAYARHAKAPSSGDLAWWTAAAFVRVATKPFRRLSPGWRAECAALLGHAEATLLAPTGEEATS